MRESGQSLFEIVIALAVISLIIVAVVILATNSIRNSDYSRDKTLATRYSQEALEWLRGQRDTNFDIFLTNAQPPAWCFQTLGWNIHNSCQASQIIAGTKFRREGTFEPTTVGVTKTAIVATIVVYWSDASGNHEVRSITKFTDWRQQ